MTMTTLKEDSDSAFCLQDPPIFLYPFGTKELYSDEYLQWMNDPLVTRTIGRFDYLMPVSREKLVAYHEALDKETTVFLAMYHSETDIKPKKEEQKLIGTVKILDIDPLAKRASIGVMVGDKENWGKSYATVAVKIASRYIFDTLGFRKITAAFMGGNEGALCAFEKNDFKVEATFKEQLFFEGEFVDHVFVCKFRDK